jgi:hypothetical protein
VSGVLAPGAAPIGVPRSILVALVAAGTFAFALLATHLGNAGLFVGLETMPAGSGHALPLLHPAPVALGLAIAAVVALTRRGSILHVPIAVAVILAVRWLTLRLIAFPLTSDHGLPALLTGIMAFHAAFSLGVWLAAALCAPELRHWRAAFVSYLAGDVIAAAGAVWVMAKAPPADLVSAAAFAAYLVPIAWALSRPADEPGLTPVRAS